MRNFNIRNGISLPCKADQDWHNTISNTMDILKTSYELGISKDLESSTFNYSIIGTDITIPIPYKVLQLIKLTISEGRNYCRVTCDQHLSMIGFDCVTKIFKDPFPLLVYVIDKKGKPTTNIDYNATIEAINRYDYKTDFKTKELAKPVQDIVLSDLGI